MEDHNEKAASSGAALSGSYDRRRNGATLQVVHHVLLMRVDLIIVLFSRRDARRHQNYAQRFILPSDNA